MISNYSLIDLEYLMSEFDIISGPTLANPSELEKNAPKTLGNYRQVAFISHRLGAKLRQYIVGYKIVPYYGQ